jgi:3-oxoacid CoA-transferase B subunit
VGIAPVIDPDKNIVLHCENGIVGYRGLAEGEPIDPHIIDARCEPIQLAIGASVSSLDTSFMIARGGHLDYTILGAFQVAANGDFANWSVGADRVSGVGGAMDLAVGAKAVWVMMTHVDKKGRPKIVERCTLPLTALGVVKRIITDYAVIEVTPHGLLVIELAPGVDEDTVRTTTEAPVEFARVR